MIEKILDSYYTKKLADRLLRDLSDHWNLDFNIRRGDIGIAIHAKPRKHEKYTVVYAILKEEALFFIANYKEFTKFINDIIIAIDDNRQWN